MHSLREWREDHQGCEASLEGFTHTRFGSAPSVFGARQAGSFVRPSAAVWRARSGRHLGSGAARPPTPCSQLPDQMDAAVRLRVSQPGFVSGVSAIEGAADRTPLPPNTFTSQGLFPIVPIPV